MIHKKALLGLAIASAYPLAMAEVQDAPAAATAGPQQQQLPMTKEVVSGEGLGQMQEGSSEAVKNVTGLSASNSAGTAIDGFLIRGIKLSLFANLRLDGGLPIAGVINTPTEDKLRVEALKGANALMFGIASPAGIINFVPKRAGAKDVTSFGVAGNGWGQFGANLDVGRRYGDEKQLGIRFTSSATRYENGVHGLDGGGSFVGTGIDFRATSRLKLQADIEYYQRHVPEQAGILIPTAVDGVVAIPRVPDPRKLLSGTWDKYAGHTANVQVRADYALSDEWNLLVQVGQSRSHRSRTTVRVQNYDLESGGNGQVIAQPITNSFRNIFYRTELQGHFTTWGLGHDLTIGASSSERFSHSFNVANQTLGQRQNIYDPIELTPPVFTKFTNNTPQDSMDTGVYAYDTLSVSRSFKVLGGVRLVTDREAMGAQTSTSHVTSPAAGALFDLTPTTTLYGSVMEGLEAGATSPFNAANPNIDLAPTISRQKELGVRDNSIAGLALNIAAFDIRRANATTNPSDDIFAYYGDVDYRGVEATVAWDVSRRWKINGGVLRLNARQNTPVQPALNGKAPENIPPWNANLNVQYQPEAAPGLALKAGVKAISHRAINNSDQGELPGYEVFDAGLNYATKVSGKAMHFSFSIDNLTNRRYWNSVNSGTLGIGMDRTYKFSAKLDL